MVKGKNHNSIVFLTTLGVYLGLVLVGGASPQVFAHSALTRNFDVQDEVEVKDDLDKKPDECSDLQRKLAEGTNYLNFDDQAFLNYANILTELAKATRGVHPDSFILEWESNFYSGHPRELYFSVSKPVLFQNGSRDQINRQANALQALFPSVLLEHEKSFTFATVLESGSIETKAGYLQHNDFDAYKAFVSLNAGLDFWRCETSNEIKNLILRNSSIEHKNNQVFVVTHLPRASIDSLLADKNAK